MTEIPKDLLRALDQAERVFQGQHIQRLIGNYADTVHGEDAAKLREYHAMTDHVYDYLDRMAAQLWQAIQRVDKQKSRALALNAVTQTLLHPMRTTPIEVLQLIFSYTIPTADELVKARGDSFSSYPSHMPFVVSSVCRKWRHAALSCPSLWTAVVLDVNYRHSAVQLQTYLERSGTRQLDVRFKGGGSRDVLDDAIVAALKATTPRWRTFTMSVQASLASTILATYFQGCQFSDLEELRVLNHAMGYDYFSDSRPPTTVTAFSTAQRLRIVENSLRNIGIDLHPSIAAQLVTLIVARTRSPSDCSMDIIPKASRLQHLDLQLTGHLYSMPPTTFPELKNLTIREHYDWDGSVAVVFPRLHLPALVSLKLTFSDAVNRPVFPKIGADSNAPKLESLELCYDTDPEHGHMRSGHRLMPFLSAYPTIRRLCIRTAGGHDQLLSRLKITPNAAPFLPRLEHFEFDHDALDTDTHPEQEAVLSMLESRIGQPSGGAIALKSFTVNVRWMDDLCCSVPCPNKAQRLAAVKAGLKWVELGADSATSEEDSESDDDY